jgi:CheY-like chemotaxis protein
LAGISSLPTKRSVVLVDDDEDILTVLKRALELKNYEVKAFSDPVKARDYLRSVNSPQVLISDIRMPGISGFELAREVGNTHPEMKIMLLTSFADKDTSVYRFIITIITSSVLIPFAISASTALDGKDQFSVRLLKIGFLYTIVVAVIFVILSYLGDIASVLN